MARPTKLTPELQASIVKNLEDHGHRSIAAKLAGIDPVTLRRWMANGREDPNGPFGAFCTAINEAEARAELKLVRTIAEAASADPRNAQWLLTHRYPERWAENREERKKHAKNNQAQRVVSPAELRAEADRLESALRAAGDLMPETSH